MSNVSPLECPNCCTRLYIVDDLDVRYVTREPDGSEPAKFLIIGTGTAGSRILHTCAASNTSRD